MEHSGQPAPETAIPVNPDEIVNVPEGITVSLWGKQADGKTGPARSYKAKVDFSGVSLERLYELARRSVVIQWQGPFRVAPGTMVTPDHWPGADDGLQADGSIIIRAATLGTGRKAKDPVKAAESKRKREEALKARDAAQVNAFARRFQAMQAAGYPMAIALDLPAQLAWEANPVPYRAE